MWSRNIDSELLVLNTNLSSATSSFFRKKVIAKCEFFYLDFYFRS